MALTVKNKGIIEQKFRILILGVGGNVSQGILKALRKSIYRLHIIGACVSATSVGLYFCDESYICPYAADEDFISWYIDFCNKHEVDMTFTGVEENIDVLLKNRREIEKKCNTVFVYPDAAAWEVGRDKLETCRWLRDNYCNYPLFLSLSENYDSNHDRNKDEILKKIGEIKYPLIAKPRRAKGSFGIRKINNENELLRFLDHKINDEYVLEKYIGSESSEYTVGCYCDRNGKYVASIIAGRYLRNGSTSICSITDSAVINEEVMRICNRLKNPGPLNIQIRIDDAGKPVCFELNVRYSGITAVRNELGFKDVDAAIKEYLLNERITEKDFCHEYGCALRFEEEKLFNCSFEELVANMVKEGRA